MEVPQIVEEEGIRGGGSNPGGLLVVDEGKHISRKEGLQVAPDPGLGTSYSEAKAMAPMFLKGVPDLGVRYSVLHRKIVAFYVMEEGLLVMKVAATTSGGSPDLRHRVVDD